MSFLPTHLPHQSNKAREDYGQLFFLTFVQAAPLPSSTAYLPAPPPNSYSSCPRRLQTQHPASLEAPQLGTPLWSPSPHTPLSISSLFCSLILSSHFTDGETEVLRKGAGSRGQWQCQDSDSGLSDSKALNLRVAHLLA